MSRTGKSIGKVEWRLPGPREADGSGCLMGTGFLLGMTKTFWKWVVVMVA